MVPRISLEIVSCGGLQRPAVIGRTPQFTTSSLNLSLMVFNEGSGGQVHHPTVFFNVRIRVRARVSKLGELLQQHLQ